MDKWKAVLGNTRIDQITPAQVAAYRNARLIDGVSPHTINLHLTILRNVFAKAVEEGRKKADRDRKPLYRQLIAAELSKKAIKIADALLSYARNDGENIKLLLENATEWPAIMSIDPARDVRKVLKNPDGMAAKFYKPVLNDSGKHTWMCPTAPKAQGVFHQFAKNIVDIMIPSFGWAHHLSFSGEVKLARKHTRFITRDLPRLVQSRVWM